METLLAPRARRTVSTVKTTSQEESSKLFHPTDNILFFFLLRTRRVMGIAKEGGSESRAGQSRAVTWRGWPPEGSSAVRRASQVNRVSRSRRTSMIFFGESHSQSDLHDSQQLESPPNEFTSKNRQTRKGNSCTKESAVT